MGWQVWTAAVLCRGRRMHEYRVYLLDQNDKIQRAEWVLTDTLEAAVEQVTTEFQGKACEIWEGTRCVARVATSRFGTSRASVETGQTSARAPLTLRTLQGIPLRDPEE
jgi:hypothetical protein